MTTKDDLKKKIQELEYQLKQAKQELAEILCVEYRFQPGDEVLRYGKDRYVISSIKMRHGAPTPFGKKYLKNGTPGNQEFELYGSIEKV